MSNVIVVKWMDNSVVHLASTFVDNSLGEQVRRWPSKESSCVQIDCPKMVHEYNKFMGGVDLNDMLLSMYRIKVRSKKWYMPIFFLFNTSCFDKWMAFYPRHLKQLYPLSTPYMSLLEFQSQVATGLTSAGKLPTQLISKEGRPSASPVDSKKAKANAAVAIRQNDVRYGGCGHFSLFDSRQYRCRHCTKGYTHMHCLKCKVFFCINRDRNYFLIFHSAI